MEISPDTMVFWQWGPVTLNATIVYTWVVMAVLVLISWLATRGIKAGARMPRWQNALETVVTYMREQIREITLDEPDAYLPFLGTLFLFISVANLLAIVPGYVPPTGSLSTTAALAICVFFAVPVFGIAQQGIGSYLRRYLEPSPLMLPFHVVGELSRTLALAVRLFGNVMSGTVIAAILVSIVPFVLPLVMQLFGLLVGQVQAYIFAVLAAVYIASGTRAQEPKAQEQEGETQHG